MNRLPRGWSPAASHSDTRTQRASVAVIADMVASHQDPELGSESPQLEARQGIQDRANEVGPLSRMTSPTVGGAGRKTLLNERALEKAPSTGPRACLVSVLR